MDFFKELKIFTGKGLIALSLIALGLGEPAFSKEKKKQELANKPKKEKISKEELKEEENADPAKTERELEADEEKGVSKAVLVPSDPIQVYGWKEWVKIGEKLDEQLRAKLDTGARTSSLHAEGQELFERNGKKWVKFIITDPGDEKGSRVICRAPLSRIAKVKNADGSVERRYVVKLEFRIGDRTMRDEFTLNLRDTMVCPVLIGRNALRHLGFVDVRRIDMASNNILR